MESLTQRITRELFESHLEGAVEAMASAENALMKAQADLAAAIGQLKAAQQDSGPFIPGITLAPLNIAKAHLEGARDQLAQYTRPSEGGASLPASPVIDLPANDPSAAPGPSDSASQFPSAQQPEEEAHNA
jgi:hypothetical protein